jgi:hypothetical protein
VPGVSEGELAEGVASVLEAARKEDPAALVVALRRIIPSFCPAEELLARSDVIASTLVVSSTSEGALPVAHRA